MYADHGKLSRKKPPILASGLKLFSSFGYLFFQFLIQGSDVQTELVRLSKLLSNNLSLFVDLVASARIPIQGLPG